MKRTIGIDINRTYISFAQLCNKRGKYYLEKNYVREISSSVSSNQNATKEIQAIIKDVINKEGFDTKLPTVISMPYGRVFFHNYKTEITSDKDINRLLKFELEDDFPIPFNDLIIDICSCRSVNERQKEYLVGAISRTELQNWTQALNEAGLNCSLITSDVYALYFATVLNYDLSSEDSSVIIHVNNDKTIIAVCEKDSLVFVRSIGNIKAKEILSTLKQEIKLTLKAVVDAKIPQPTKIFLTGSPGHVKDLYDQLPKEINSEIIISDPFKRIIHKSEQKEDDKFIAALGLALIGMEQKKHVLNFLAADKAEADQIVKTKRNSLVFAVLLVTLAVLLLVNFFTNLQALEDENKNLEQQIREVFVQTFPEEKTIVNELAQMDEKYKELETEYNVIASEILGRVPTIKILKNISEKISPEQNVAISSISITSESAQLAGTTANFESVDNLVEKFEQITEFDSVEIRNVDVDPVNNWVRFNLLIKFDIGN